MPRGELQISFPGVSPRVAERLVQELQQDLASDPIDGLTAQVVKPDPNTLDMGTVLTVFGTESLGFWTTVGAHTVGHVTGAAALTAVGLLLARLAKKAAKEGVTPTVTPMNAPPEAEKAIAELKAQHGVK